MFLQKLVSFKVYASLAHLSIVHLTQKVPESTSCPRKYNKMFCWFFFMWFTKYFKYSFMNLGTREFKDPPRNQK